MLRLGENFVIYVKKNAVKEYLSKHGVDENFLIALYAYRFARSWDVLADVFNDEWFYVWRPGVEGEILPPYFGVGRYRRRCYYIAEYFNGLFKAFGAENILVTNEYASVNASEYVSLDALARKVESFLKDAIKDYDALLSDA